MHTLARIIHLVALLALGCTESARSLEWEIVFEDPAVGARARVVEGSILQGGCAGSQIYVGSARPGETPPLPPSLAAGHYGFAARAIDASCVVIAEGCTEADLPRSDGDVVTVTLVEAAGAALCAASACTDGTCAGMDAGARDAGPPIDGGILLDGSGMDAPPPGDGGGSDGGLVPDAGGCAVVDAFTTGSLFSCAITSGLLYCWGGNLAGQLGNGTSGAGTEVPTPARVGTRTDWAAVGAGNDHVCAITTAGALWCWGDNEDGQIGTGDLVDRSMPFMVAASGWAAARGGRNGDHTCLVSPTDAISCLGQNDYGQLGVMDLVDRMAPTAVIGGGTYAEVSLGHHFSCGVRSGGALYCWGRNDEAQLGQGTVGAGTGSNVPIQVGTATGYTTVGAGEIHACAVRAGELWCWGSALAGRLGTGDVTRRTTPTRIGAGTDWAVVSAGINFTCGTHTDGSVSCTGANGVGQLGTGDFTSTMVFVPTVGIDDVEQMQSGDRHTCALRAGGELFCWGDNTSGQLGQGDMMNRNRPTPICIP